MATGDQDDMLGRLKRLLPAGWFGDSNPILDALLWGYAQSLAWAYTLYLYAQAQTRIKTATDNWLDLIALDFFGNNLVRGASQGDTSYRSSILINLFRERTTRPAMEQVLLDLTGRAPIIIEPARPADVGGYGSAVAVSQPGITTMLDAGLVISVPPNTARYQGGQLLVESAITNYCLASGNFGASSWGKTNASLLSAAAQSPDNQTMAGKLIESTVNGYHYLSQNYALAANTDHTFSCFLKAGERSFAYLETRSQAAVYHGAFFNLTTGAVVSIVGPAPVTAGVVACANGWFRCWITYNTGSGATTDQTNIQVAQSGTTRFYAGDGVSSIYAWGAQLEAGQLSTYVPTWGTAVSRAADTLLTNMPSGSAALGGYGAAGAYGSISLPYQAFITAFRPIGQGLPYIAGYGIPTGAYSTASRSDYAGYDDEGVTDADIYAAIAATKPEGTAVWARISS